MKNSAYLLVGFFLLACSSKDTVNLVETNFQDHVPLSGNLSFIFDKNLVSDTLTNIWDTTQLIQFDPPVPGRYSWKSSNELLFSPARQLAPATQYQASFSRELVAQSSFKLGKSLAFSFQTPLLEVEQVNAYWAATEGQPDQAFLHVSLEFNHPVQPAEVASLLQLQIDDKNYTLSTVDENITNGVSFYTADLPVEDKELAAHITIGSALKPFEGQMSMEESLDEKVTIPSPFNLAIQDVNAEHDGVQGSITVATSQKVSEQGIKKFLKLTPSVPYEVQVEANGFTISSEDFDVDKTYDFKVIKGLKGAIGGELKYENAQQVSFGKLDPGIKFVDRKASYLAAQGNRNLEVRIINVPEVQVKITKVYENNIQGFLNSTQYYWDGEYEDYYYDYSYSNLSNLGDVVWEQTYQSRELPRKGSSRLLHMDFQDKINGYEGLYVVEVQSSESYWVSSRKVVAISDIGLIAKEGKSSLTVFANSLKTAQPLANVELTLIGSNNQVADKITTNSNGVATYRAGSLLASGFKVGMITARTANDFNYLPFSKTKVSQARFDVGGNYLNKSGYQAFIYGERDIYRPGETLHFATMVRDELWQAPGALPLTIKLISPNGQEQATVRKVLDAQGMAETNFTLAPESMTGTYLLQVFTSNEVLLNTHSVAIEEFIPDRIKVSLSTDKEEYVLGESVAMQATATNFFGPPAANRNYEIEMSLNRKYFTSKEHVQYRFDLTNVHQSFQKVLRSGKTSALGEVNESFLLPNTYENMGVLQADFFVTVFDETGRPVNRRQQVDVYTQQVFYGLRTGQYYYATSRPIKVPLIAVDGKGTALNGVDAQVKVIKHEYKTVLSKSGSYFRYRSEKVEKVIKNQVLKLNGTAQHLNFTPELSGQYEVRISAPGVNSYVSRNFYVYGWGSTSTSSFQVNNEGRVDITFDKEQYTVGDEAKILFKAPFSGRLLVTVEREEVLEHFYLDTDKRSAELTLPIRANQVPNVYVSATLFKPHKVSELPLTVAHGFAPMMVENPAYRMPIAIEAASNSRSGVKQTIKVKGAPNSQITVAVVDEGILQLTGFQTPNPHDFFFARRALGVNSYDVYPYLFPEIQRGKIGGDGMNLEKRINPLTNKRVKLISFWSGIMQTDDRGNATYDIEIPEFSGDLRIMAAAARGSAFAGTHANMKVADPVVLSVALPRFFSPKDTVEVPVVITNTTNQTTAAQAKITLGGPIQLVGSDIQKVSLGANEEQVVRYRVVANPEIGAAHVKVLVSALGEEFTNKTDISVRPASPLQKVSGSGIVKAGSTVDIKIPTEQFLPASMDRKVLISKSPMVEFADDLDYLLRYPYGCVEQTVSSVFPQLYYPQLVQSMLHKKGDIANVHHHINEAINRLQLMQLHHGGLSYWPGTGSESWWGSVYAAHFLWEAKQQGYDVNDKMLKKLFGYLKQKLRDKRVFTYYYNSTEKRDIAPKEVAYTLFVLALADQADKPTMNYYKARMDRLSLDGKYLLSAAYALSGDQKKAEVVRPAAFKGEETGRVFGGSFYSMVRDESLALYALVEYDPDNLQVPIMAKHISQYLKSGRWLSTQERIFSLLALGKIAEQTANTSMTATITVDGKKVGDFQNKDLTLTTADLNTGSIAIRTEGTGQLYYFWEAEGISKDGSYKAEDSFLRVRKQFYNRDGQAVNSNKFKQNDLIVVKLSLQASHGGQVENVVVSDILPAGFEIENARIGEVAQFDWIKDKSYPEYQDIRDDRINMFTTATRNVKNYYYVVRAVSQGRFQMGPVGADAMYDGEYHSYNGGGVVIVE